MFPFFVTQSPGALAVIALLHSFPHLKMLTEWMRWVRWFISLLVLAVLCMIFSALSRENSTELWRVGERGDRIVDQLRVGQTSDRVFMIYQEKIPSTRYGFQGFHKDGCAARNCFLTDKQEHISSANVIVLNDKSVLPALSADQLRVLHLLESPVNTPDISKFNGQINLTATYRHDSDIVTPYGRFQYFKTSNGESDVDYSSGKTKLVAWIVSNCFTNNGRMQYAHKLSDYVQVDIYGKCGWRSLTHGEASSMLRRDYKFYLAFENSNCKDYVTEKFFNALRDRLQSLMIPLDYKSTSVFSVGVVPIVLGPSRSFYERIAPPHSFIHVQDYRDEKTLAEHLVYLDRNATAYNEYFEWQRVGRLSESYFYCRLCALVQQPIQKVYSDVDQWWRGGSGSDAVCS